MGQQDQRLGGLRGSSGLCAVRAPGAAGLGAGPQRLVHDLPDGLGATSALGAAAEASIDLRRRARKILRLGHDMTHVMVGQDVAGTNNHGMLGEPVRTLPMIYESSPRKAKGKQPI